MIKSKKQMFIIVGAFILVLMLFTTTYAFFNYTRTGSSNNIRVGRISFVSKNEETITLNNLFPIDPSNTSDMNDNTKVGTYSIDIKGDTDYVDGIEYLVSAVDANIYTNQGQIVPISLDVTVSNGLGTNNTNYFTEREQKNANIYKKLVGGTLVGDQMLLVGYIKPNTTSGQAEGVDGSITIKAYLDKGKILISDTYDGTESDNMGTTNNDAERKTVITTTEWNSLQSSRISFKVKVEANEGIWVNGSLEEIMKKDNIGIDIENGVDFSKTSEQDNTMGVYMRAGTQNDDYPILYYRGAVEDNNVLFNNLCWKAVRTTDTGGVKLIYNGDLLYNTGALGREEYGEIMSNTGNYTYDESDNSWHATMTETVSSSNPIEISFKLPVGKYSFEISGIASSENNINIWGDSAWTEISIYVNNTYVDYAHAEAGEAINDDGIINVSSSTDIVSLQFYGDYSTSSNPSNVAVKFLKEKESLGIIGCGHVGIDANINIPDENLFVFNTNHNSPAYNGYMYGDVYTYTNASATSGAYYGSSFTYDGTNYTLVDPVTTKNNTHHYTCNLTTAEGTCTSIRYYYYGNYYVNLTGGDGIEEAMEKMQTNTNDSNAKTQIDNWYASNMNTVTSKLEDTIWCNDRSVGNGNNNGWIANGGDLNTLLCYGAKERSNFAENTSAVKNRPSLSCENKNDRFTRSNTNGNRKLTYPVALLTEDEMVLAGGLAGTQNTTFYLSSGYYYWSMSPLLFEYSNGENKAFEFFIRDGIFGTNVTFSDFGLRPAISIKPGQLITKGTGTVTDPYVIE